MKKKKHIDELFTNSFQDFEATPSPEVWNNIQTEMARRKKDRKVIPLWWKLGGVAALLALLLTVGNSVFNSHTTDEPALSSEDTPESFETTTQPEKSLQEDPIYNTTVATEDPSGKEESNVENVSTQSNNPSPSSTKERVLQKSTTQAIAVEPSTPNTLKETKKNQDPTETTGNLSKRDAMAVVEKGVDNESDRIKSSQEAVASKTDPNKSKDDLLNTEKPISVDIADKAIAETEVNKEKEDTEKRSLIDEVETQNAQKAIAPNDEKPSQRWAVSPQIAPVYYNSL
ncbi:MAG: hypothetical protein HKM28_02820, partial [Flavobacteriaceae bacterium]|nr:hypothetical protein [Flavobacteriaceae bacterium]